MEKKNNILIIPDVHGREFWKNPVTKELGKVEKIVFLGDYLDPYPQEEINFDTAINNFKEIIQLKKDNPEDIILLYGNHDLHYIDYMGMDIFPCSRYNKAYSKYIESLITDNKDLFNLFYRNGKYIFSHAGIEKEWMRKYCKCESLDDLIKDETKTKGCLWVVDYLRGGRENYGSPVWSDVRVFRNEFDGIFQIFGHTQLSKEYFGPVSGIYETFACLDCRKCFLLDLEDQSIISYDNNN